MRSRIPLVDLVFVCVCVCLCVCDLLEGFAGARIFRMQVGRIWTNTHTHVCVNVFDEQICISMYACAHI